MCIRDSLKDMRTYLPTLMKATVMTLLLVLITMLLSPVGGLFIALGRISRMKVLSGLFWCYIWIFRGTPLLLQLFFIYYGLPSMGITLEPFPAAVLGLGLNYSAYLAEIMRGAIESIDAGQMEAAKSLGMSYWQAMRRIIIPQTYKRLVPPVGNEFVALLKDSSLVSILAVADLLRRGREFASQSFTYFETYTMVALVYLMITLFFSKLISHMEEKISAE